MEFLIGDVFLLAAVQRHETNGAELRLYHRKSDKYSTVQLHFLRLVSALKMPSSHLAQTATGPYLKYVVLSLSCFIL